MTKFILIITIFSTILVVTYSFSQNLLKKSSISETSRYTIEETVAIVKAAGDCPLIESDVPPRKY